MLLCVFVLGFFRVFIYLIYFYVMVVWQLADIFRHLHIATQKFLIYQIPVGVVPCRRVRLSVCVHVYVCECRGKPRQKEDFSSSSPAQLVEAAG